jgi:peptide/nickel transport system ATP-binding protein
MNADILQVRNLRTYYHTTRGAVKAVDDVTFSLAAEERFGLVGESGSGKTTVAMSLLRLIKPPGKIEGGEAVLGGRDLMSLGEEEMRQVRLAELALVAQGSMNSLNPVIRVREQIVDGIKDHNGRIGREDLEGRVRALLERVGLRPEVAGMYPHQLSGGMKQRVCIAIAMSLGPKVIIADEPTSALDVVVQVQVMETLRRAQEEVGAAIILVGHDMGLMAQFVERLGIMYAGRLVEVGSVSDIFHNPLNPYTQLLINSVPSFEEKRLMEGISGLTPSMTDLPSGCLFHPRCPYAEAKCSEEVPELVEVAPNRWTSCYRP